VTGGRPLTGRTVLAVAAGGFGVILAANLTLAWFAVGTFSGVVVNDAYRANQDFDAARRAQESLGWRLAVAHDGAALRLDLADARGRAVRPEEFAVVVGRPTTQRDDRALALVETPTGYAAEAPLDPGAWLVMVEATAPNGVAYRRREPLWIGTPRP
jgi:nitrogen fixation protein FixH